MNTFRIILAFFIGTGAGILAGVLTAPRSGKKTRKKLVNEVDATKKSLEEAAAKKLDEAREILHKTVETPTDLGKKTVNKVKEALHMG